MSLTGRTYRMRPDVTGVTLSVQAIGKYPTRPEKRLRSDGQTYAEAAQEVLQRFGANLEPAERALDQKGIPHKDI